jgi:hypothetical protein
VNENVVLSSSAFKVMLLSSSASKVMLSSSASKVLALEGVRLIDFIESLNISFIDLLFCNKMPTMLRADKLDYIFNMVVLNIVF